MMNLMSVLFLLVLVSTSVHTRCSWNGQGCAYSTLEQCRNKKQCSWIAACDYGACGTSTCRNNYRKYSSISSYELCTRYTDCNWWGPAPTNAPVPPTPRPTMMPTIPDRPNTWEQPLGSSGLTLDILNALEFPHYREILDKVVDDWQSGPAGIVTLSVSDVAPVSICRTEEGKLKVCSGNYGATDWLATNKILLQDRNTIYSASIRLNDYYLMNETASRIQYSLCRAFGTVFGIPQNTKVEGNCMDVNPDDYEASKSPGLDNFHYLYDLYGSSIDVDPTVFEKNAKMSGETGSKQSPSNAGTAASSAGGGIYYSTTLLLMAGLLLSVNI